MADDLDRAGRGSGGAAGRAGVIQAGRSSCRSGVLLQVWGSFAGREGVPAGLERILSFFSYFGTDYI